MNHQLELVNGVAGIAEEKQQELSAWPSCYPDLGSVERDAEGEFSWYYEKYNPGGVMLIEMFTPMLSRCHGFRTNVHIQDDLLQIVISARLGEKIDLSARAYAEKYIVDLERKLIYSAGADREAFTKDDITLAINPEVIAF